MGCPLRQTKSLTKGGSFSWRNSFFFRKMFPIKCHKMRSAGAPFGTPAYYEKNNENHNGNDLFY